VPTVIYAAGPRTLLEETGIARTNGWRIEDVLLGMKTAALALSDLLKQREDRAVSDTILRDNCSHGGSVRTSAGARTRPWKAR